MKIVFYSWDNLTDAFKEMSKNLAASSVDIIHAVYDLKDCNKLKTTWDGKIYILQQYLHENWDKQQKKSLTEYVAKYELPNIMELVYADRHIRDYKDIDTIFKFVLLHIQFWEDFFEKERPDYLVSEAISGLSIFLAYLIGKKFNCVYLGITHSRIPGKFYISEDEFGYSLKTNYWYLKKRENLNIDLARRFADQFKREKTKPSYMTMQSKPPQIGNPFNIRAYLKKDPIDYFYTNGNITLVTAIGRKFARKLRYFILSKFKHRIFELPHEKEKFILFPVHFQPEASTMVQAPFFENQVAVIENIARAMPYNIMLYVKDHYAVLGSKSLQFYQQIKKLPNVRLINPYIDSHSLIQKAEIVVTITGTPGWEAILYNRPVLVFGNVFYDIYTQLTKVTDFTELPNAINKILNRPFTFCSEDERDLFVAAYLESLYDGEFDVGNLTITTQPNNIQNLTNGLMNYIKIREDFRL
jgi:hypothetical protein